MENLSLKELVELHTGTLSKTLDRAELIGGCGNQGERNCKYLLAAELGVGARFIAPARLSG